MSRKEGRGKKNSRKKKRERNRRGHHPKRTREGTGGWTHSQILVRHFLAVEGIEQELAVLVGVQGQDADAALLAQVEDWLGDLLQVARKEGGRVDVQRAHGVVISLGCNGRTRRGVWRRVASVSFSLAR